MTDSFTPVIYMKYGCPFCFKLRLALLEAGMLDEVKIQEFNGGSSEETTIKQELAGKLDKMTFPAAEIAPGNFMTDSDALIEHFLSAKGIAAGSLPTLNAYKQGPFQQIMNLFKENRELKKSATN